MPANPSLNQNAQERRCAANILRGRHDWIPGCFGFGNFLED